MSTAHLDSVELVGAYTAGMSASALARRHGVSIWSIITRLRKAGVDMRSSKEQNERRLGSRTGPFLFRELVDGLLLGDGQIDHKNVLRISQCERRAGWLDQIAQHLSLVGAEGRITPRPARTRHLTSEDRLIKGSPSVLLYTPAYVELQAERRRWYPDDTKQVPRDLRLTEYVVAHWFAGDGTYNTNGTLTFCTNSFTADEVDFLIGHLAVDLNIQGAKRTKTPRPGQYTLGIYRANQAAKLAKLIEPLLPECCLYKLQHIQPTTLPHLLPGQVREIRQRRIVGETVEDLVAEFDVSVTTVHNIIAGRSHRETP